MAKTVADIFGQPKFDIDSASGSVSGGSEDGARSDTDGNGGNQDITIIPVQRTNNNQSEHTVVNPADAAADESADYRSRGNTSRARSSRTRTDNGDTRTRTRAAAESEIDLAEFLVVAHQLLARALEATEFEISPLEAKVLGSALKRVLKHLPKLVKLTPMQEAISGFLAIAAVMYVPRYFKYSARTGGIVVDAQKEKKDSRTVASVGVRVGNA
jgi:hypothetical protein